MDRSIIPTKLHPPQIPIRRVSRKRLLQRLDAGWDAGKSLCLISAPAGYGKTTLVLDWVARLRDARELHIAWLALDGQDNGIGRFWTYLNAALATAVPEFQPIAVQPTAAAERDKALHALLTQLQALNRPLLLVLDDFHELTDSQILAFVARLVDYLPARIQFLLTSRTTPALPLPRWQVRNQLTWLTAADLRFTGAEIPQFFHETMQLATTAEETAALQARTEGWVAGLQLAAISLRAGGIVAPVDAISGADRHVADYLVSEVLTRQEPQVQLFLMEMAAFDRFCAGLGDFLQPERESQTLLETVERRQLFIVPLDNARSWYRLHHLFQELLQDRLRRELGETAVVNIHRRAVHWFVQNRLPNEGIHYAFLAGDKELAATILEKMPLADIWQQGQAERVSTWVAALPASLLETYPRILLRAIHAHILRGDFHEIENYMAILQHKPEMKPAWQLLRAIFVRNEGDISGAIALIQEARPFLEDEDPHLLLMANLQLATNYLQSGQLKKAAAAAKTLQQIVSRQPQPDWAVQLHALNIAGYALFSQGDLAQAEAMFQAGFGLPEAAVRMPISGIMHNGLGVVAYFRNDLETAAAEFAAGLDVAEKSGISDVLSGALLGQVDLARQRRDWPAMQALLERIRAEWENTFIELLDDTIGAATAFYHLRWGELDPALEWARGFTLDYSQPPPMHRFFEALLWVNVHLAAAQDGRAAQPLRFLGEYLELLATLAAECNHQLNLLRVRLSQAVLAQLLGETAVMRDYLLTAIELGRGGALFRLVLDAAPPVVPLLQEIAPTLPPDHPDRHTIQQLQLLWGVENGRAASPPSAGLVEPLTERESEMLQCIAAGYSNRQIQEKFTISRNTVRTHLKNLYGKLGVDGRETAVQRARELHLI